MNKSNLSKIFHKTISKLDIGSLIYQKVKIIKKTEKPIIEISLKNEEINNTYNWIFENENGNIDEGKFIASALKKIKKQKQDKNSINLEFNIPLNLELGYHNFKILQNSQIFLNIKLIVVPEKCFIPDAILKNEQLFGLKINLSKIDSYNENNNIKSI